MSDADRERESLSHDALPLDDFAWSDDIVGMGFFPDEVALPAGWSWETERISPRR